MKINAFCDICKQNLQFEAPDSHWSCRDSLKSQACPYGGCVVRERALASAIFKYYSPPEMAYLSIHEAAPTMRGLSYWMLNVASPNNYIRSGYWPEMPSGTIVNGLVNCDLTSQPFEDEKFDIVIHLDVLEHLFEPFLALRECMRTLRTGGRLFFTAPVYPGRIKSEKVAFVADDGSFEIIGTPEYHGNPQRPEDGALVTWRYGSDLASRILEETTCDVEMISTQQLARAILGTHTEVFIVTKVG